MTRGIRVIISRSPCVLYMQRLGGKKRAKTFVVGPECRDCRHCLDYFGCPALQPPLTGEGPLTIDEALVRRLRLLLATVRKEGDPGEK